MTADRFLGNFLVCQEGDTLLQASVASPIARSGEEIQVAAALLRGDAEFIRAVLCRCSNPTVLAEGLERELYLGGISSLFFERVCGLDLLEPMSRLNLRNGESLVDLLRARSSRATAMCDAMNRRFLELAGALRAAGNSVLWLKGTALSRTLYRHFHHRWSRDFDLLVRRADLPVVVETLEREGFRVEWNDPGHCPQAGTGPTGSLSRLSLTPDREYDPLHNLTLLRDDGACVELKSSPLEQGLRMKEIDRLFDDAERHHWQGAEFFAPSVMDHLMIELTHLHKHGFRGWQWLYDIHLLASSLSGPGQSWDEVVRRCHHEGVGASAWAGLEVCRDRLHSEVPEEVLSRLAPGSSGVAARCLMYSVSPEFLWNLRSLPALLINATFLGDGDRKRRALFASLVPSRDFLAAYYKSGETLPWWQLPFYMMLHWLVVVLPGGLVRRTFGRWLWHASDAPERAG